eukprot:SAG11_NODE_37218_length_258_cov_0.622642_1_plen_20_part_01
MGDGSGGSGDGAVFGYGASQ